MNGILTDLDSIQNDVDFSMPDAAFDVLTVRSEMKDVVPSIDGIIEEDIVWRRSRYKVLYGGRGSGKSHAYAKMLVFLAANMKLRILCTREMQNSIKDSVHRLLCDQIEVLGLQACFTITENSIKSLSGSEFIFKGLHHHIKEIKSLEGIDIAWVEEAEAVSDYSWSILIPTIRKAHSEIWISFNPEEEKSATYTRFVLNTPPDCLRAFMTWRDLGDHFPEVLMQEMEYCKRVDPEAYEHIWEGKLKKYGEALILHGKFKVEAFDTPVGVQFFYGMDFGYSSDPTALVRCFVKDQILYIDYEAYGHGIEIDQLEEFMLSVPESRRVTGGPKWEIRSDSARPDTISHLKRRGFNIVGAEKGKGSVEDGTMFLRSFVQIIVHPRCVGTKLNFENWRWKVDEVTGQILPVPEGTWDHIPDALRYALEKYTKHKTTIYDALRKS